MNTSGPKEFTGRHMLVIMIVFFGIIIAVNLTMAVVANKTWTGLVVKNTYVASQQFNEKMAETRAQAALQWTGQLNVNNGIVSYRLVDSSGRSLPLKSVTMKFMRPVGVRDDRSELLTRTDSGDYIVQSPLANGTWLVEIEADAGLDKPFRETLRIQVANGARS